MKVINRVTKRSESSGIGDQMTAVASFDLRDNSDRIHLNAVIAQSAARSKRSWQWYDEIPEVNYGINRSAKVAGHAMLQIYDLDHGTPDQPATDKTSLQFNQEIFSPYGGQRHLIGRFFQLMRIRADSHLIRNPIQDGESRGYDFISSDELKLIGDTVYRMTMPGGNGAQAPTDTIIAPEDYLGRVWVPHPQWVELPNSPMQSLDTVCEELHLLTLKVRSSLYNRIALAGIIYVPTELSEVKQAAMGDASTVQMHSDKVIDAIIKAQQTSVDSHGSALGSMRMILRGPGDQAQNVRFIDADVAVGAMDISLREEALRRIMQGLDLQPESVVGRAKSNHWNTWATRDEELKVNITPDLQTMAWALTRMVYWPWLLANGKQVDKTKVVWFDPSGMEAPVNGADDARQLFDRGQADAATLRKLSNVAETSKPLDEEYVRTMGWKNQNPWLATYGLPIHDTIDWEEALKFSSAKAGPSPSTGGDAPPVAPGVGDPGSPSDIRSDTPKGQRPQ